LRASSNSYSASNRGTHIDRDANPYTASSNVHAYIQHNTVEYRNANAHVIPYTDANTHANIYADSIAHSNPVGNSTGEW
jgi:hypothetical protein